MHIAGAVLLSILSADVTAQVLRPSISAELKFERTELYVREQVPVVLEIRASGDPIGKNMRLKSLPDPKVLGIGRLQELRGQRRIEGGRAVDVRQFRGQAQGLAPGQVRVAPVLTVESFMWGRQYDVPIKPVTLTVRDLPGDGRPDGFSGAVGRFTLDARVAPDEIVLGDLVTLTMTVSGDGDLTGVLPPAPVSLGLLKAYEPRLVSAKEGTLTYEQVLIPQATNALAVPPVVFSYFDPVEGTYRTLSKGPFPLAYLQEREKVAFDRYRPDTAETGTTATAWWKRKIAGMSRARRSDAAGAVVTRNEDVRFAPYRAAIRTFGVVEGDLVRVLETYGEWAKIAAGEDRGWIPISALRAE